MKVYVIQFFLIHPLMIENYHNHTFYSIISFFVYTIIENMNSKVNKAYNRWTDYQDTVLQEVVERCGRASWNNISKQMRSHYQITKRTGKQCRQRWLSQINALNNRNQWTQEDDEKLFEEQKKFGTKWNQIAKCFPGRTDNSIKNRFYSKVRKSLRRLCKFAKVKTTKINVYQIKPCTLTHIFKIGHVQQDHKNDIDLQKDFSIADYKEILRIILLFIQKNSMPTSRELQKQRVVWVIQKLMQLHSLRQEHTKSGQEEQEKGLFILQEQNNSNFYYDYAQMSHDRNLQRQKLKAISDMQTIKQEKKTSEMMYQQNDCHEQRRQPMVKQQFNIKTEAVNQLKYLTPVNQQISAIKVEQINKDEMIKLEHNEAYYIQDSLRTAYFFYQASVLTLNREEHEENRMKTEQQQIDYRRAIPIQWINPSFFGQTCKREEG